MLNKLDFLSSRRFWALVIIAILKVFGAESVLSLEVVEALKTLLLSFVVVGTVDKLPKAINR